MFIWREREVERKLRHFLSSFKSLSNWSYITSALEWERRAIVTVESFLKKNNSSALLVAILHWFYFPFLNFFLAIDISTCERERGFVLSMVWPNMNRGWLYLFSFGVMTPRDLFTFKPLSLQVVVWVAAAADYSLYNLSLIFFFAHLVKSNYLNVGPFFSSLCPASCPFRCVITLSVIDDSETFWWNLFWLQSISK